MSKVEDYRRTLRTLDHWDAFLLQESRLPGPRANLELAQAVAEEGDGDLFDRYGHFDAAAAPANSPPEFLAFCGVLGLGRLLSEGKTEVLKALRHHSSDSRWRVREAVAKSLQRLGRVDMETLLQEMEQWSKGILLERRAAAAALCEPRLLRERKHAERALALLHQVTASIRQVENRRSEQFKALRKGLGYCWSVAVAALPEAGKPRMERWFGSDDKDVRWIMKQNLRKNRLARMDPEWVASWKAELGMAP